VDGVAALEQFATEIDRLNLASKRPNPFLSAAFLLCYALRIEYHTPGLEERLYLIWDGDRLIGCAPMRRSRENFGPGAGPLRLRSTRVRWLAPLDTEEPGILAAPEDIERVARALIRYLCEREHGWGMLEFVGQRPGGTLHRVAHAATGRTFRVRDIPVEPYNEIPLVWGNLRAYFQSLSKKMRSNISRQARRLFAAGEPEIIVAQGAQAVTAWFDAYCDLDGRSWKDGTEASIQRHPRRVRFYREIAAGRGGLDPAFIGIVLEGVLIAGLILGSNSTTAPRQHRAWCLEMAYDRARANLGPGQLLLLLAVGLAIEKGHTHLSFMQNFAYYKHRWAAEPIDVCSVQIIRRISLHNVRASLGDLKRKLADRRQPAGHDRTAPEPNGSEGASEPQTLVQPNMDRARELVITALARGGNGVRRLDRGQSQAHLPFELE
jgi:hypothetical protein